MMIFIMYPVVILLAIVALSTEAPVNTDTKSTETTPKPPIILAENQYLIEFEDFAKTKGWANDSSRTPQRSGASNYKSLHLYKSEEISVSFCVPIEQEISIKNIYFSNDGWVDNLAVEVDGERIGDFKSADSSNWGYLWNNFNYTGTIGEKMNLPSGRHELTIMVEDGDEYGVELDAIKFEFSRQDLTVNLKCPEEAENSTDKTEGQNYPEMSGKTPISSTNECSSADCKATPMSTTDESNIKSPNTDSSNIYKTNPTEPPNSDGHKSTESSLKDNSKSTDPICDTPNCKSNPSDSDMSNPTESVNAYKTKATDAIKPEGTNPTISSNSDNTKPIDNSTDSNCVTPNCKSNPPHSDISNPTELLDPDNTKVIDSSKPENTTPAMSSNADSTKSTESYKPLGTSNPDCESPDCKMSTKLLNTDSNTVDRSMSEKHKPTESVVAKSRKSTMSPVTDSSKPTETSNPGCETPECEMNPTVPYKSKPTISSNSDSTKSTASSNSDSTKPASSSNSDSTKHMESSNLDKANPTKNPKSDSPKPTDNSKPTDPNCLTPECKSNPSNAGLLSPNSTNQMEPTGSSKTVDLDCETPECKMNRANSDSSKSTNHDNTKPTMLSVAESSKPTDASNADCETVDCKKGRSNPDSTKPTDSSRSDGSKPTDSLNTENNELKVSTIAKSSSTSNTTPNPDCETLDCKMNSVNPTNPSHTKYPKLTVESKPECETLDCNMGSSETKKTTSMNIPISSDCKTADCTTDSSSSDTTKTTETSISNSSPEKDEEIYKISCPKQKLLTVRKNDYQGCADDGKIRFDIYGAAVSEVTFVVPHPFVPPFPSKRHIFKRSPQTNVLWEDGYPREDCSLGQTNPLNENIDISRAAADGSLPITIFPKSTPSMNLAFKLTPTGLNIRKKLRPVFTIGACCTDPSNISLTAIETDTNTVVELGEQEFQFEDTIKSWIFPSLSDWDDRNVEVKIDFSSISQPIILNYMKFEIQELDSTVNDSPVSPPKILLCETEEVKVEGLQEDNPNKKKLKFRLNGSQTTSEVSSLVFSPSGIDPSQTKPALVIDQFGYCSFNPQSPVNVTDSVAFILGSTDPTSETPRLAIDEVELEPDVNSDNTSIILHLLGSEFGTTTVQLKITETETRLTLLQIIPVGKPISSFFLPCSGEDTIAADGADDISVRKPWKSISGEQFTIRRR